MNNKSGILRFDSPEYYEAVMSFADSTKPNFEAIRKMRPADMDKVRQAIDAVLNDCQFQNCKPNPSYIKALGLGEEAKNR